MTGHVTGHVRGHVTQACDDVRGHVTDKHVTM